jgi:hypothetical protein
MSAPPYITPGTTPEPDSPQGRAPQDAPPHLEPPDLDDDESDGPEDAAPAPEGEWRPVEPDEIFEPGRSFRVDVSSGQAEVLNPPQPLVIDRSELARFVTAMFAGLDPWGYVSLRAFPQRTAGKPLHIQAIRLNTGLEPVVEAAVRIAAKVCNGGEPGVFAPPVCTFASRKTARAADVHEGPAISIEIDAGELQRLVDRIALILGARPTITLHSGSLWADPETGELLPKGHAHWRLARAARGPEQLRMLRRARDIATMLTGGDPSATPPVHPMRWPGTWNLKTDRPVMARIVEANDSTIDLADALAALEEAAQLANLTTPRNMPHLAQPDTTPAEVAQIVDWLAFYPNTAAVQWNDWNNCAMAIHRVTGGSEAGFEAFRTWSATSHKHSDAACRARWDAITGSPATWIGANHLRRKASEHGWTEPTPGAPEGWEAQHPPVFDDPDPPPPHCDDVLEAIRQLGPGLTLPILVGLFNQKYAVANEGGKALVMWTTPDPQMRRDRIERATFDDFRKFYCNHHLTVTVTAGGKPKKITKTFAAWWLDHPSRRQYLGGVVFSPGGNVAAGTLNLWRGWAVDPTPGDWSLMATHIHNVICKGRGEVASYVLRWLAHMIQHPDQPAEIAIVMRGLKGIGKGLFGKRLLRLCGQHGLHIINAAHLTGHFTGHLRDVIFVFADEALYAGDKQHEGILKGIITEGSLLIEAKYRTPVMAPNVLHLLLSSNNDWVVPASHDERRYLMLDVSAAHQGDFAYFAALDAQMENGGLAAMLNELSTMDLRDFHPRKVPDTPELADQKLFSLDSPARWWLAVLARGFVWRSKYGHADFLRWDEFVTTELLTRSYAQWNQENRISYPAHRVQLGKMLAAIYPASRPRSPHPIYEAESIDPQNPLPVVKLPNQQGYKVGLLDNARTCFRDALGLTTVEWAEEAVP